jgi:hypothetical protein
VANNLNINPVFTPYLPINEKEEIENLSTAVTSGIISKETAVENNPLVSDPESEKERIKSDQTEAISGSNI